MPEPILVVSAAAFVGWIVAIASLLHARDQGHEIERLCSRVDEEQSAKWRMFHLAQSHRVALQKVAEEQYSHTDHPEA